MLKTKPYKIFIKYIIPSILGFLAVSSAGIVDGYFIGNYVGEVGLASVNISYPITTILFGFGLMFAVGSSTLIGKLMGEKKTYEASDVFTKAIISVFVIGSFICVFLYLNIGFVLDILNVQEQLRENTLEYLPTILLFVPFLLFAVVIDYCVRVDENPNLSFFALLSMSLSNMLLDYIFIVKFSWGISGAALATGISYIVVIFILLPHFFTKKATLRFTKVKGNYFEVLNTLKNGASEFINESSAGITILIFNYIILKSLGTTGLAAYTIIGYFILVVSMISFAISDGLQPIISKNYGALSFSRISKFLRLGFVTIIIIEVFLTLIVLVMPEVLIELFLKDGSVEIKKITIEFISYSWLAFLFIGLNILITAYLTSIQKPLFSVLIAIMRSLILPVFFILTLPCFFGNVGIFLALVFAEIITFMMAYGFFVKNNPKILSK